jgi:hypothetical protein
VSRQEKGDVYLYRATGVCLYAKIQGDGCVVGDKVVKSQVDEVVVQSLY